MTVAFTTVVYKWRTLQMIPGRQDRNHAQEDNSEGSEPVILGMPSGLTRKISVLEAGECSRWSEIRRRNRLTYALGEL